MTSYAPLRPTDIRLLVLDPGASTDSLCGSLIIKQLDPGKDIVPEYEAMSYTWGDQTNPDIISLHPAEGKSSADGPDCQCKRHGGIAIGRNLSAALHVVRHETDTRVIWADSICINQNDLDERAAQVRRMGDIFARARRVLAWLGPADAQSRLAIKTMAYLAANIDFSNYEDNLLTSVLRVWPGTPDTITDPNKDLPLSQAQWEAIESFIKRTWFRRLWVRQEIALAGADTIVIAGEDTLPWMHLSAALEIIGLKRATPAMREFHMSVDYFTARSFSYMRHQRDFASLVAFTHCCEVTDPRDLVYGLLGVASGDLTKTIPIDYARPIKTVYRDALSASTYWHQNTALLSFCDSATKPTWIPDLDQIRHLRPMQMGRAALATAVIAQNLSYTHAEAHGIRGDFIAEVLGPTGENDSLPQLWILLVNTAIRYLGPVPELWATDKVQEFCHAVIVRDHEIQPPHLDNLKTYLALWVGEYKGDLGKMRDDDNVQFLLFAYYLRGRCLYLTKSDYIALGPRGCQPGDLIFVFLGSNLPSVLHAVDDGTWQMRGPINHPALYDGEVLMGQLPKAWKVKHLSRVSKPVFESPDGVQQRTDPRLDGIPLPGDWELRWSKDDSPFWYTAEKDRWTTLDPRITMEELEKRGVRIEKLVLT